MNSQAYTSERFSPPREGPALLQGLIICDKWGLMVVVWLPYQQDSSGKLFSFGCGW